jgi:hypothetical protein
MRIVLTAALLASASAFAAAPQIVDVSIPLQQYVETLQTEGVQEFPSLVVFKPDGGCLQVIDTPKPEGLSEKIATLINEGTIRCSVKASEHFDKTGGAGVAPAAAHLQLVLLESPVCSNCEPWVDAVQTLIDARQDLRLIVVRVKPQ